LRDWRNDANRMVDAQLVARGISDAGVLRAMRDVPRHRFVGPGMEQSAYGDHALPIGEGQTISQPYMVALMTEALALSGGEKVLEIGTGSGYQTAVLAALAEQVFSVERVRTLAERARDTLEQLGVMNVAIMVGDGTVGWSEFAPFDRIIVTAGAPNVPESVLEQLADPGVMVIPVGSQGMQQLVIVERKGGQTTMHEAGSCVFVPLVGREGWGGNNGDA
jgi:protein-L-isoaspartate(D-aspartate) O-methyltransferase